MALDELDDTQLLQAFLAQPPLRHLLPLLGRRRMGPAEARRRQALYRALSCTDQERMQGLLFSALTEPIYRQRGSMEPVPSFTAVPEAARVARLLVREGWSFEEIHDRLAGLQALWEALDHTLPDTWRVQDAVRAILGWQQEGAVGMAHRSIEAAAVLWRSDGSEAGVERLVHFESFIRGLITVF
ncbi:MAG: hypothetical protein FJ125_05735 [Deltaproteobacteria bacterium]|nr:hypothetical protein [Deltaproteobacteria bacterium]